MPLACLFNKACGNYADNPNASVGSGRADELVCHANALVSRNIRIVSVIVGTFAIEIWAVCWIRSTGEDRSCSLTAHTDSRCKCYRSVSTVTYHGARLISFV